MSYYYNNSLSFIPFTATGYKPIQNSTVSLPTLSNSPQTSSKDNKGNNKDLLWAGVTCLAVLGTYLVTRGHYKAKLPSQSTGNKAEQVVTESLEQVSKNKINGKSSDGTEIVGDLLEEQNRALVNNPQYSSRTLPTVYKYTFGNPNITPLQLSRECAYFKSITGAELHIPSLQAVDYKFAEACSLLEKCAREHNFPKDIKHVIIGHGTGSSVNGDWQIINGGGYVFRYIKSKNIPEGEKILILSCENGPKISMKHGVGDEVELSLMNMNKPAKIVESGKNEIIGDLYFPPRLINQDIVNPCVTYYNVPKPQITINKN